MLAKLKRAFKSFFRIKSKTTLQSFRPFPDEILPLIFHQLTPLQRCHMLSVCRNWNGTLLRGKSFWQVVHLPHRLPISTAFTILQIFNSRSGFSLEEVVFESLIDDIQDIDRIFEELKKSSLTIRALALPQLARLNTQTRNLARSLLPRLRFLYSNNHGSQTIFISVMWEHLLEWGPQRGVEDPSNEKGTEVSGLRYYSARSVSRVGTEEKSWFKELQFLQVHTTYSLEDLHLILEASKSSLQELNLCWWGTELEDSENVDLDPITLENSTPMRLILPFNASAAKVLARFLKFSGRVEGSGNLASLLCFEMTFLVEARILIYDKTDDERKRGPSVTPDELKEKTDLFLEMNPSLSALGLYAGRRGSGSAFHLNYFLERLIAPSDSSSMQQHRSPNATQGQEPLLLPKLKFVVIHNPFKLNGILLRNCLESRKKLSPSFKILVWSKGGWVREREWQGKSWMK